MFDWEKAFKVSRAIFITTISILILAIIANWDFTEEMIQWSIDNSGDFKFVGEFMKAIMLALRYIDLVDLWLTIISAVSTLVTYIKKVYFS